MHSIYMYIHNGRCLVITCLSYTHIMLFRDQINTKCTVFAQKISRNVERKDKKKTSVIKIRYKSV